ncbi:MAG: DNA-processing protein DprA [Candidatus Omnitrophota bacterium]
MTRTEALIALNLSMDIGSIRLQKLLDVFGNPQECAQNMNPFPAAALDQELAFIKKYGCTVVTLYDESYPLNLRYTADKPIVLYIKGALEPRDNLSIAMVGCRRPSFYGIEQAGRFSSEFGRRGITVISGMARGIDTCSHEGVLKAGGRTVAVMGSGLGHIYPPENGALAQRISQAGAVVSEFPVNTGPQRFHFPRRNRIISGLALGTLVVEAGRNSGSLITAHCALEQGRDVFALPGRIDTPQASGTNALIKEGACPVACIEDILENLPFLPDSCAPAQKAEGGSFSRAGTLSCLESTLYNIISCRPVQMEVLMEGTKLDIAQLSGILLGLQLKGLITQVAAGTYIRSVHAR